MQRSCVYYTPFAEDGNFRFCGPLTKPETCAMLMQTVEAEITLIMLPQRVRVAENRMENKSSNGPRRAQSKAQAEYSAT